jgi:protein TonB
MSRHTIVDQVFARRHPAESRRWFIAAGVVTGVYAALFVVVPLLATPSLEDWAAMVAARVHGDLDRNREIAIEAPPPPPPPPPAVAPSPPRPVHAAVARARAAARPPAPARTGAVIARAPEASPLDFTATAFVTGTASTYAGGASTSSGTNSHAVEGRDVSAAGGHDGGRARGVSLDEASWSCPWPREADSAGIDEQTVLLKVNVDAGGGVQAVTILADPGSGFAQAARACALRTRFRPAVDATGQNIAAWSPPIRVRFLR